MGVLLMLITIGGSFVATILLVAAIWKKIAWLKKLVLGGLAVWFVFYAAMLFGFSFLSEEKQLALNEPKEYCGFYLDCHLHTNVLDVRTAKQIGTQTAQGTFYIVKVKVSSDAKNPNIAFRLLEPKAEVTDENGKIYTRIAEAENQLPTGQVQLNQDIKGKETIEKEIVFDVPVPNDKLKLLITEGYGVDKYIEAVLIDDDDSILHKQKYFRLEQKTTAKF
ncbi:hypothetical protein BH10ACI1_BH10ACI1_09110 [soil metagenome]